MAGEIVTYDENKTEAQNVIQMIAQAARDPNVDVGKMTALVDLQERIIDRNSRAEFNAAFVALQHEMPTIGKRGEIKNKAGGIQSRYSKWEDIYRVIMPLLKKHGFVLSHRVDTVDRTMTVEAVLAHVGGHSESSGRMPLALDTSGSKNATQGAGSAMSYGKRYTTVAILNILTENEDDDGSTATTQREELSELESDGRKAASTGLQNYARWFKEDISNEQRRQLSDSGWHERLKAEAAKADGELFPGDA